MRRILDRLDSAPSWQIMIVGVTLFSIVGFTGTVGALLSRDDIHRLAGLLSNALLIGSLMVYSRRRQHDAWTSGVQLAIVVFGAGWLVIVALRIMVPKLFAKVFGSEPFMGPALGATVMVAPLAAATWAITIRLARSVRLRRALRLIKR